MDHQKLNILLIFGTFSFGGCGGQECYFWPNPRVISKNSAIQNFQTTFKPKLACIFLPTRAKWSIQVCVGTPCTCCWKQSDWRKISWKFEFQNWKFVKACGDYHLNMYLQSYKFLNIYSFLYRSPPLSLPKWPILFAKLWAILYPTLTG